jgi:hypothetical protein
MRTHMNEDMVSPLVLLCASIDIAAIVLEQLPSLCQLAGVSHEPFLVDCASGKAYSVLIGPVHELSQINTKMCV